MPDDMFDAPASPVLQIEIRDSLAGITPADWDALDPTGNPFLRHAFLHALESAGCLGERTGWYPRTLLLWSGADEAAAGAEPGAGPRELVGAVPAYVKTNSYGEFVFDWAWAEAFQRHGHAYYPKLVVAVPFTPATGPRLLVRADQPAGATRELMAGALRQFAESEEWSGIHYLFVSEDEQRLLCGPDETDGAEPPPAQGATGETGNGGDGDGDAGEGTAVDHLPRLDCQYHWRNDGYASFDDFLAQCTSKRRKTLRRERRYVSDAGLRLERRSGETLTDAEWECVHAFYNATFDRKWGNPSLTGAFFREVGRTFGRNTLIVFAYDPTDATPDEPVACSVMFHGGGTLYGRYWGCRRDYNALHFEACYYQGIEHCIEHGIERFEPGAQGEHKITRGFEPTLTRSAHWIFHDGFRDAVAGYLDQERPHVRERCNGLNELLPFKADIEPA